MPVSVLRNLSSYNVKDFGAVGDGSHDDTVAISAANSMASGVGGIVFFPPGTYISGKQIIYTGVHWLGSGITATLLTLKAGTNDNFFEGYFTGYINGQNGYTGSTKKVDLSSPANTGVPGGLHDFSFKNMTIDGNRANQSGTSNVFYLYGYGYLIEDVNIRNGLSNGFVTDWNGGSSLFFQGVATGDMTDARFVNVKVHNNGGIGFQMGGPHDSQLTNVISFFNDSHAFHFAPNAVGTVSNNCHAYGCAFYTNSVGYLVEAGFSLFTGCESEGSDTAQVVFLSSTNIWVGGHCYMSSVPRYDSTAFQLGQVGATTVKTAATTSPITLTTAPLTIAFLTYLQFVITGASTSGSISITGTGLHDAVESETITASGNGTFTSVNQYKTAPTITVTGLTGYSITVVALPVPYTQSTLQSGGVATATYAAGNNIHSSITRCEGPNGAVWFNYSAGNNKVETNAYLTAGNHYGGSINALDSYKFTGSGQAYDGTIGKGGGVRYAVNSFDAFKVSDRTNDVFSVNTTSKRISYPFNATAYFWNDAYATENMRINNDTNGSIYWHAGDVSLQWRATGIMKFSGGLCVGASSSAAAVTNNATITTNSVGIARIAPASDVTGLILQAGQINGQECWVVNESTSFSATMAASGTSIVADGTNNIIPPNQGKKYVYDGGTSLWYASARDVFNQGHLVPNTGTVPTVAALSGNGTSPPTPTITGNDTRGNVLFGSGTAPSVGSNISVTFAKAYLTTPIVMVCATNIATGALNVYAASASTTGFNISCVTAPTASQGATTYSVNYQVMG